MMTLVDAKRIMWEEEVSGEPVVSRWCQSLPLPNTLATETDAYWFGTAVEISKVPKGNNIIRSRQYTGSLVYERYAV